MGNSSLQSAKNEKNDEFYTNLSDIEKELENYSDKFKDKVVFCNCDDLYESNFVKYFLMNFNKLGLKELIVSGFSVKEKSVAFFFRINQTIDLIKNNSSDLDIFAVNEFLKSDISKYIKELDGNLATDEEGIQLYTDIKEKYIDFNGKEKTRKVKKELYYNVGDFRSEASISLLQQADIVVTNPPFSLFREFISLLMQYEKQFLILGNMNAITYKEFFPLLKDNKVWLGCNNGTKEYKVVESYVENNPNKVYERDGVWYSKLGNTGWFTNIDHKKRHTMLPLNLGYSYEESKELYQKYDNYDAININKVSEIPYDYKGIMGVPITFLDKYCPEQFEIVGVFNHGSDHEFDLAKAEINGIEKFKRIAVKLKE